MKLIFLAFLFFAIHISAQSKLDVKIMEGTRQMACPQPDEGNPVTLKAQLVNEGDSIAVIVKASMAEGWHIYAYVPSTLPYIAIENILQLPEGIRAVGTWKKTEPTASAMDPGVLMYGRQAVFIHKAVKLPGAKPDGVIKAGLYYQTCDLRQCLPPEEQVFPLKYE